MVNILKRMLIQICNGKCSLFTKDSILARVNEGEDTTYMKSTKPSYNLRYIANVLSIIHHSTVTKALVVMQLVRTGN